MSEKDDFLKVLEREFTTTLKVFKAFPADNLDFKPHQRSRSAKELIQTAIGEEALLRDIIEGHVDFTKEQVGSDFGTLEELLTAYQGGHTQTVDKLSAAPEEDFQKQVDFGGWETTRIEGLWELLMDSVHHRGQFSVYLRMAGGKVPSIYGPSADEPMNI